MKEEIKKWLVTCDDCGATETAQGIDFYTPKGWHCIKAQMALCVITLHICPACRIKRKEMY